MIAGAAIRVVIVVLPFHYLMQIFLPDDAYYYFDIAQNIAAGNGITYDGLGPTNGFHPLWLAILVPVFGILPKLAAVRVAVGLSALIDVFNIALVGRAARQITGKPAAANIAAFIYAINVPVILIVINAMESALLVAFMLGLLIAYLAWRGNWTLKRAVIFGLIGGGLILSRTDGAIFFAIVLLAILIRESGKNRIMIPVISGVLATAIVAPFLIWNTVKFGSPMQVSGKAIPLAVHREHKVRSAELAVHREFGVHPTEPGVKVRSPISEGIKKARNAFFSKMFSLTGLRRGGIWLSGVLLIFFLIIYIVQKRGGNPEPTPYFRHIAALGLPMLFMLLLAVIHGGLRWFIMTWYFAGAAAIWAMFLGISAYNLLYIKGEPPRWAGIIASVIIALLPVVGLAANPPKLIDENPSYVFHKFVRIHVDDVLRSRDIPPDTLIGAFNSGIFRFYSDYSCVNLDGVVSYNAFRAIENRTLDKYIRDNEIKYIVDRSIDFDRYRDAAGLNMKRLRMVREIEVAEKRDHWTREIIKVKLVLYEVLP